MFRYIILIIAGIFMLTQYSCKQKDKRVYIEGQTIEPEDIHWVIKYLIDSTDLHEYFPDVDVRKYLHDDLKRFYEYNEYQLAWNSHNEPKDQAEELIAVLRDSWKEGLEPENYRVREIDSLEKVVFQKGVDSVDLHRLIHLDLMMTSSFLTYASHLVRGRIDPQKLNKTWFNNPPKKNMTPVLKKAVDDNKVKEAIEDIRPSYAQYRKLQDKLVEYHEINKNGGWPQIADGPELKRGDRGQRVDSLVKLLSVTGDLPGKTAGKGSAVFSNEVESAVKAFQQRHWIKPTGIVDQTTLQALNTPVSQRIAQIKINLERMRWMPKDLGNHYVMVNVPEFFLRIVKNEKIQMQMKVIVGEEFNSTPIFSDTIEHLVFSPYWHVPRSIATDEMLPKIKENPGYLQANHYELLSGWEENPEVLDPYSIKWNDITEENFQYRIRQKPGPWNSLGDVKFMFPNDLSIYLHDTPADHLFSSEERGFSHGCIRVEKPKDLAEYLLSGQPGYNRQKIVELMERDSEVYVHLDEKIPVHIIYWTTFVDDDGKLNFSKDVYNFDELQIDALQRKEEQL